MSPKYSTDRDQEGTHHEWHTDRRFVLAEWESKPFVGHRHRHETVHQRLVVEYHHGVGLDVMHQARSEDSGKFPDDWTTVEYVEYRGYGARHHRQPEARWLE